MDVISQESTLVTRTSRTKAHPGAAFQTGLSPGKAWRANVAKNRTNGNQSSKDSRCEPSSAVETVVPTKYIKVNAWAAQARKNRDKEDL
ncbi:hypothetical protein AM500_20830 [Bacillus sp. FJAT-18017]|uniref:hypothetical protein n=1 Tax=unclassified Bacillus (in: firmicutes) TaxID=185979 RepID=UPI0005C494C8|nr:MULTISPECIES: hypothetical protein [unclassified Bacillus (in: firmicutes)]ALC91964.1 hypothetical protein AM500_20830 [Bacillus sp. FJAT-18017]